MPTEHHAAAVRLVSVPDGERMSAASRLVQHADAHGINLDHVWVTGPEGGPIRQAVLMVPGSGRTAMVFCSKPRPDNECGSAAEQAGELAACVQRATAEFRNASGLDTQLAQALPAPTEQWTIDALTCAGWQRLGGLAYLRCRLPLRERQPPPLPGDVRVEPFKGFDHIQSTADLQTALSASYEDTLDCPGLTGLRTVEDIIESHASVGQFDPDLWSIVYAGDDPAGCVLLSRVPDQGGIELVYIGIAKPLRGRGLGKVLLTHAAAALVTEPFSEMTCAVDTNNQPALDMYASLGFERLQDRAAFVFPLTNPV